MTGSGPSVTARASWARESFGTRVERVLRPSPPRRYQLDDYKRWFPRTGRVFRRYLQRTDPFGSSPPPTPLIGVVVGPWVSTPVPWYAILLAVGLRRRGRSVAVLWDDTGFPELHLDEQNATIAEVLDDVSRHLPVTRLSELRGAPPAAGDADLIDRLTAQNVTWITRGAESHPGHDERRADIRASLSASLPHVRAAVAHPELACLVVPGGVYGTSGLFLSEAERRGCRVATFDTDRRIAQICARGVAAQHADVPDAFDALWHADEDERRFAIAVAQAEFQSRVENRDSYGFQTAPAAEPSSVEADAVLVPLNVVWDTAALGRHTHFSDTVDWVTSVVEAVLDRDAGPVIVRQHPSERRKLQRSKLDVQGALRERFGDDPRCRFVAAEDPVSSYDLLRSARLVLPFVSTIAIEAAAMGKPVLISGAAYFADLGFVRSAASRQDYLDLLDRGLRGDLGPLPHQQDRAWICYYLSAVRNRITTDFTPHPDDFWTWIRADPDQLFDDPAVGDIVESIDRGVPVALLRHRRAVGDRGVRR